MWIRAMLLSDLEEVMTLESGIFSDAWSISSLRESILSNTDCCIVLEDDYNICGYAVFRVNIDEAELFRIAVKKEYRRQGIAGKMMDYIVNGIKNMSVGRIFLEVRSRNPGAVSLYKSYGFQKIGTRRDYYTNPADDAVIMEKKLC